MRMPSFNFIKLLIPVVGLATFFACNDNEESQQEAISQKINPRDLTQYTSHNQVMMQAFYWDVPKGGVWWDFLRGEVGAWAEIGIDKVWLPQFAKSASGANSMGYDPADYFDLGEFDQYATVETRFGSKEELLHLVETIHDNQMEVIADIVINHNGGGALEHNPLTSEDKHTLFTPEKETNKSGRFNRDWSYFHPNYEVQKDEGAEFFSERDLCLQCPKVQDELWLNENSLAQYYKKELGIDGWRFDYVKGFNTNVIKQWNEATGNMFSVGEYFDGNAETLKAWVENSASAAFDFATFYNLEKAFDSKKDLNFLGEPSLLKLYPDKAVTFVSNHDVDDRAEQTPTGFISTPAKLMAYAYILTHPGIPTIFYSDYEQKLDKTILNKLITINKTIATGDFKVLYISDKEYIASREGDEKNPGLIVYFNMSPNIQSKKVGTKWKNKMLFDYSNNTLVDQQADLPITNAEGVATIGAPAHSYAIWSIY